MTTSHYFLNCTVKDIRGRPCTGVPVTLICVSHPTNGFQGNTDADGAILRWTRITEELDQRQLFVQGLPGTLWRVTLDAHAHVSPDQPFPFATVDFFIPQDGDGNITFVLGPHALNVYNSVPPPSAQEAISDAAGQTGSPYLLGRRNSSSVALSAFSDLSPYILDDQQPLLADMPNQAIENSPRDDAGNSEIVETAAGGARKRKRDVEDDRGVVKRNRHQR